MYCVLDLHLSQLTISYFKCSEKDLELIWVFIFISNLYNCTFPRVHALMAFCGMCLIKDVYVNEFLSYINHPTTKRFLIFLIMNVLLNKVLTTCMCVFEFHQFYVLVACFLTASKKLLCSSSLPQHHAYFLWNTPYHHISCSPYWISANDNVKWTEYINTYYTHIHYNSLQSHVPTKWQQKYILHIPLIRSFLVLSLKI